MSGTYGIDHLGLTVSDLAASQAFFVEALGWRVFGTNETYPAVYITDGHSKLTLWQQKGADPVEFDRHNNVGLHHVAFKIPDSAALVALFDRVAGWPGVGVEYVPEFSGTGPKEHFMICEPGGNRMEFSYDPR